MIGVVIADDELKICRLIEYLIPWDKMGLELLGTAYNGKDALDLISEKRPDVLLTDIRMPGMDGLELIAEAKKIFPELQCIIISGYKDFEYAQQGLRFGIKDYLLKPINQDELARSLEKISVEIRSKKSDISETAQMEEKLDNYSDSMKQMYLRTVVIQQNSGVASLHGDESARVYLQEIVKDYGMTILMRPDLQYRKDKADAYRLLQEKSVDIIHQEMNTEPMEVFTEIGKSGIYIMLLGSHVPEAKVGKIVGRIKEKIIGMRDLFSGVSVKTIIGSSCTNTLQLKEQIGKLTHMMSNRVLFDNNQTLELENIGTNRYVYHHPAAELERLMDEQEESFRLENPEKGFRIVREYVAGLSNISGQDIAEITRSEFYYYLNRLRKMDDSISERQIRADFYDYCEHCTSAEQIFDCLEQSILKMRDESLKNLKNREIRPINYAKQYIEENNGRNISVEEIAKLTGFSYSYFSALFKKETGKTVMEYIQYVRIEAAKKLLMEKDQKVMDVASQVGYSDVKFFTKQFKKAVGVSPGEFQKLFHTT